MRQIVIVAGIVALLVVTSTIAAGSYIVQPAKAAFGKDVASYQATQTQQNTKNPANGNGLLVNSVNHNPSFGDTVSSVAKGCAGPPGT
jgi:hypothetical protein